MVGTVEDDPEYKLIVQANSLVLQVDSEIALLHKFVCGPTHARTSAHPPAHLPERAREDAGGDNLPSLVRFQIASIK